MKPAQAVSSSAIEADIARIESGIKQLKVQYDMFFAGALTHEPIEQRHQLEKLIRRYTHASIRKYSHRFHLNAMVSRFNSLSELWTKSVRSLEEGDRRPPAIAGQAGIRERLLARCRLHNGANDCPDLRRLYSKFVDARRSSDNGDRPVSFDSFVRGISRQTERLRKDSGCAEIELRVVLRDQKVQVKARPAN